MTTDAFREARRIGGALVLEFSLPWLWAIEAHIGDAIARVCASPFAFAWIRRHPSLIVVDAYTQAHSETRAETYARFRKDMGRWEWRWPKKTKATVDAANARRAHFKSLIESADTASHAAALKQAQALLERIANETAAGRRCALDDVAGQLHAALRAVVNTTVR